MSRANKGYEIRSMVCDWALDIPMGDTTFVLYFNSQNNAELVKAVLEWEDAHPNEAIPYQPTLTPPNEWVSRVRELDELYTKLQAVTGFTAEQLLEIFAAGYTLKKPDYSKHFAEMENLAEAAPTCKIKDYAETCDECGFCDDTLVRPPEGEEE